MILPQNHQQLLSGNKYTGYKDVNITPSITFPVGKQFYLTNL